MYQSSGHGARPTLNQRPPGGEHPLSIRGHMSGKSKLLRFVSY